MGVKDKIMVFKEREARDKHFVSSSSSSSSIAHLKVLRLGHLLPLTCCFLQLASKENAEENIRQPPRNGGARSPR
eukprot:303096-Hanusia_phi.AAC.1